MLVFEIIAFSWREDKIVDFEIFIVFTRGNTALSNAVHVYRITIGNRVTKLQHNEWTKTGSARLPVNEYK